MYVYAVILLGILAQLSERKSVHVFMQQVSHVYRSPHVRTPLSVGSRETTDERQLMSQTHP